MRVSQIVMLCFTFCFANSSFANKTEHSKVDIKINKGKKQIDFEFRTLPQGAIVINDDENSPWQLSLTNLDDIDLKEKELVRKDFKKNIGGFSFSSSGPAKTTNWKFDYRFVVFICTKDKAQCFREVHKGTVNELK